MRPAKRYGLPPGHRTQGAKLEGGAVVHAVRSLLAERPWQSVVDLCDGLAPSLFPRAKNLAAAKRQGVWRALEVLRDIGAIVDDGARGFDARHYALAAAEGAA